MRIRYERSSVCMGDDVMTPNAYEFELDEQMTIYELAKLVIKQNYLASIQGGKATWVMSSNREDICVIAQQWDNPKMMISGNRMVKDFTEINGVRLFHFSYLVQADPDVIYDYRNKYSQYFYKENLHGFEFDEGLKTYHEVSGGKKLYLNLKLTVDDIHHMISFKNRHVYRHESKLYYPIHDIKQSISRKTHLRLTNKLLNEEIIRVMKENDLITKVYEKNDMIFYVYQPIREDILVYVSEDKMARQLSYDVNINENDHSIIMDKIELKECNE